MFSPVRYVKSREEEEGGGAVTPSARYDLCALYVLCDPASLSLYSPSDRVTPRFFSASPHSDAAHRTRRSTLIYSPSQRSRLRRLVTSRPTRKERVAEERRGREGIFLLAESAGFDNRLQRVSVVGI